MSDLVLPTNGSSYATLGEVLRRLERLEMAAGLMADVLSRAAIPEIQQVALRSFALTVATEKQQRDKH